MVCYFPTHSLNRYFKALRYFFHFPCFSVRHHEFSLELLDQEVEAADSLPVHALVRLVGLLLVEGTVYVAARLVLRLGHLFSQPLQVLCLRFVFDFLILALLFLSVLQYLDGSFGVWR